MKIEQLKTLVEGFKQCNPSVKHYLINGTTKKRLAISQNGYVMEMKKGSSKRGYILNDDYIEGWLDITPKISTKTQFQTDVSNCVALIMRRCTSRALDKYFENGDYTKTIVEAIKKRALKNEKLKTILLNEWRWTI
jgi:hypothetical protein